jgi:hypothetical protein
MAFSRNGRFSDYQVAKWLDEIRLGPCYMGLLSSDPYVSPNPSLLEVTGTTYGRATPTLSRSGRVLTVTSLMYWEGINAGSTVAYIGAFDALINGNFLFASAIPLTGGVLSFPAGGYLEIAANTFHAGLDA